MPAAKRPAKSAAKKKSTAKQAKRQPAKSSKSVDDNSLPEDDSTPHSLLSGILSLTDRITGSLVDVVKTGSAIPLMYSDNWLKELYIKSVDPDRLSAMADAGVLMKDAREVAGLSLSDLAEALGLKDTKLLLEVEGGRATLPFDIILRIASLIARHDPIPFILKFVRTYNPNLEKRLDDLGVSVLPRQYERERRLVNLYRQHDVLRSMSDPVFDRLLDYQEASLNYALEVMLSEKKKR